MPTRSRRGVDGLRRLVDAGLGVDEFRIQSLGRLRRLVTIDAAFYATVDHTTMVMTSALTEEPLAAEARRFLDNEYATDDVNKFTSIADRADAIDSLDRATGGDRTTSVRYRDLMAPIGLGDEVRLALRSRGRCWGVMCLHRENGAAGFSADDFDVLRAVAPILGEGLRRGLSLTASTAGAPIPGGPGVLDANLEIVSANPQAERWLAQVDDRDWPSSVHLPIAVLGAAASVLDDRSDVNRTRTRVRRTNGGWMTVHASPLPGEPGGTLVVLDTPELEELTSLVLAAHGLTPAQCRVAQLVLRGRSTQQIVNELRISANTVQEHLRGVFDKFGVGSRRELVASLNAHSS